MKVCLDCPRLIPNGSRCPACTRAKDQERGSREARGYGHTHRRLRAEYQNRMTAGERFSCWRCGNPIDPGNWHLGHTDGQTGWAGPEHPDCNIGAANRNR